VTSGSYTELIAVASKRIQ